MHTKNINTNDSLYGNVRGSTKKSNNENTMTKQEITKLLEIFDEKFNELHEIKNQLKKLLNDSQ